METSKRHENAAPGAPEKAPHLSISALAVNSNAVPEEFESTDSFGAVVAFLGVVRGLENGRKIDGIRYSAYQEMAEQELDRIGTEGQKRFDPHPLFVHHTTGFVAAGDASLVIRLALPHSKDAFVALQWYLRQIKQRVPVWKEPVFTDDESTHESS